MYTRFSKAVSFLHIMYNYQRDETPTPQTITRSKSHTDTVQSIQKIVADITHLYYYFDHILMRYIYSLTMVASKRSLRSLLLKPTSKPKLPVGMSHCWETTSQ